MSLFETTPLCEIDLFFVFVYFKLSSVKVVLLVTTQIYKIYEMYFTISIQNSKQLLKVFLYCIRGAFVENINKGLILPRDLEIFPHPHPPSKALAPHHPPSPPLLPLAESVHCRAGPQSQKWSDQQITLNPTGSIHKKSREKKFDPKKVYFDEGVFI